MRIEHVHMRFVDEDERAWPCKLEDADYTAWVFIDFINEAELGMMFTMIPAGEELPDVWKDRAEKEFDRARKEQ